MVVRVMGLVLRCGLWCDGVFTSQSHDISTMGLVTCNVEPEATLVLLIWEQHQQDDIGSCWKLYLVKWSLFRKVDKVAWSHVWKFKVQIEVKFHECCTNSEIWMAFKASESSLFFSLQNQLSGNLLRKFKNSNGWQKLWVVFTNFSLFFYKSHQVTSTRSQSPVVWLWLWGWWCAPSSGLESIASRCEISNLCAVFEVNSFSHAVFHLCITEYCGFKEK